MSIDNGEPFAHPLERAVGELQSIARSSQGEIESVAKSFQSLSGDTDELLNLAATIVASVESDKVSSVLPRVQNLGAAAKSFIEDRLQATSGILDTVTAEVGLLHQLSGVTRIQGAIALKISALSVLTKIEAARLGKMGEGFQYLACELSDFSKSLTLDTQELAQHTESRQTSIQTTKFVLSADLPRMQEELARIEALVGDDLALLDSSFERFSSTPERFRLSVQEIAGQISGVVAAVQTYDITRQQLQHVQDALAMIAGKLRAEQNSDCGRSEELSRIYAGLGIQSYQLNNIKATLASWTSQIRTCMAGILNVSSSEVAGISPLVLDQEREVSSKISHIESLEKQSQAHSDKIRQTLAGLSNLAQLIGEHIQKSKTVLNRLHLLSLNSMIEASSLGSHADTILAIAKSIVEISAEWRENTDQSGNAMQDILKHVERTNQVMEAFSESSSDSLHTAQAQTRNALDSLKAAAAFAAHQSGHIGFANDAMRTKIAQVGKTGDLLDRSFGRIDAVLDEIEELKQQIEIDHPAATKGCDTEEVEHLFSAAYTTEVEREVLRAALRGTAIPVLQQSFGGNSIELF
jgi:ElaB/YqjD/DUF883 family membrane-anchored ribosome-binding protein